MPPKTKVVGPIPKEALEYIKEKRLKPSFNYDEVWGKEHSTAFTVAKIMELEILSSVRESLATALEDGVSWTRWSREIQSTLGKSGWANYNQGYPTLHRLRIIFGTNMRTARAVGQWERIQKTKDLLPYLVYELGPSIRHRPEHEILAGIAKPADDQFWDAAMPPNGYNCKCYVEQLTQSRYDKLPEEAHRDTPLSTVTVENSKTGERQRVPAVKVDGKATPICQPGFGYNPGKQALREKAIRQQEKDSMVKSDSLKDELEAVRLK